MADDQVVTNIVARADFSDLIANVRKVTTSLAAMQQQIGSSNKVLSAQINAVNRSFGETLRSTGQFSTHFVSLANDVDTFGKRLDGGKLKLRDYFSTLQTHTRTSGGLIRDLARQQVQLQNAILQPLGKNAQGLMQFNVHVPQGLDQIKNKGAIARQEMQILNKVMQEGSVGLINWGKNTQWAGRQLTVGLTVPIVAFGAAAAKAFREADQELTRLTKVYGGLSATSSSELQKVRRDVTAIANELARGYGASFKETLALSADIAATGKQGSELLGSIRETTRLAVLGEVDRQDAMKATLAIQSAFRQDTDELAKSINFLNAVENQTSTSLADLVEAIPKAGPIIKGLGGDIEDLALYLTAMKEGGINASEGANAIKSALASLINPTDVAVKKFEGFGIDLMGIVNNNAGDVTKTLFALQGALNKLDPLQKSQAIEQLFGKFQFARLSALFENLGAQGSQTLKVLDLMKASSKDLESIAGRELSMVTESASGKYRRAVEGLKADLAGVGEEFLKVSTFFINLVDGIVQFVNKLPAPIKTILTFLAGLTAVTGPLIMLTGVLANFLGYVIKGAFHLKALFKGGEGWRMLTPEILAANQAGSLIEKTFYSDAKAALALAEALQVLSAGMTSIQSKMTQGVVSVQPMLSTVAGSVIKPPGDDDGPGGGGGIGRVVDPKNPLVGPVGTRASAHMVPRSGMSQEERAAQTIHSFLPAPIPVNQAVGANPQIFAAGDLPSIPGLTTIPGRGGQVSTGVVASEAAKWHTMVGALSMMTKTEVAQMKTQIRTTGTVTSEFTQAFGSLLPQMTSIASSAASQSAMIVAEAKAGTISVQTARQRIIALNIQVEQLMAQATMGTASSLGRTAVLTGVPTLDQPVVDPKTGKSNMRELFKKGKTRSFVDDLARLMGVRTWGAGYSTHTTIPIRRNMGGKVYNPEVHGNVVPGDTSINYDNTPAVLREGGFILNQSSSRVNPDLVKLAKNSKNAGGKIVPAILTPGETYFPPEIAQEIMPTLEEANSGSVIKLLNAGGMLGGRVSNKKLNYGVVPSVAQALAALAMRRSAIGSSRVLGTSSSGHARTGGFNSLSTPGGLSGGYGYYDFASKGFWQTSAAKEMSRLYGIRPAATVAGSRAKSEVNIHAISSRFTGTYGSGSGRASTPDILGSDLLSMGAMGSIDPTRRYRILPAMSLRGSKEFNEMLPLGKATAGMWQKISAGNLTDLAFFLHHSLKLPPAVVKNILEATANRINYAVRKNPNVNFDENTFGDLVFDSAEGAIRSHISRKTGSWVGLNNGGIVPGGMVSRNRFGYGIPALSAAVIARLTSKWRKPELFAPPVQKHDWTNTDPLHGPLFIGKADIGGDGVRKSLSYHIPSGRVVQGREGKQLVGISPMFSNDPRYLIERYMQGDKAVMARMQYEAKHGLNSHPLSIQSLFKSVARRFRGTLYRGMTSQSIADTFPKHIVEAIEKARATGDFSALIGREFIMRRASFTANRDIARFFAPGHSSGPMSSLLMEARLFGRKVTPTSKMFPDIKFEAPYGQNWSTRRSPLRRKSEEESLVGGKFTIVGFDGKKLIVEGRAMGGPVSGATPYVVGERGPELFVPKNSGRIIPSYELGGIVKGGKINYGVVPSGNPVADLITQSLSMPTLDSQMRAGSVDLSAYGLGSGELAPLQTPQSPQMSKGAKFGLGALRIGGSLGGFTAGQMLTSKVTGGNMILDSLGGMAAMSAVDAAITGITNKVSGLGKAAGVAGGQTSFLTKTFEAFIGLPGPLKLLAVVVGVGVAVKALNDKINEHKRIVSAGFGVSEESAKKLGLSYTKLGSQVDEYRKKLDLANAAAAANKYATSLQGGPGIDLTVPQFEKLKKSTKKDFATEISMFDTANEEEALQRATNLKAAYVATGMSVEDANALIYAMLENSNKANISLKILADSGFSSLDTKAKAAERTFKTFADVITKGDMDQLPIALQTASDAFSELQKSMINTTDNSKELVTSGEAYERVLQQVLNTNELNNEIGRDGLFQILKQNESLRGVISSSDTFAGVLAKIKLSTSGIVFDLENMSSATAAAISIVLEKQKDFLLAAEGPFSSLVNKINSIGKISADQIVKNANRTKESIQAEIALRQKNIQKIKDEADAKKKALEEETEAEDFLLQIQKKQIEYSEALASGNMAGAAQAQLDIQSMTGSRQLDLAKTAIDDKADKDIRSEQKKIDALNNKMTSLEKNLQKSIDAANLAQKQSANLKELLDELGILVIGAQDGMSDSEKDRAALLSKKLRDAGFGNLADQYLMPSVAAGSGYASSALGPGMVATPTMDYDKIMGLANKSLKFAISGGLLTSDPEVLEVLKAMKNGMLYGPSTRVSVSTDNFPGYGQNISTVKSNALAAEGIKVKPGTVFVDKNGNPYRVGQPLPSQYQSDLNPENKIYRVEALAAGGMIKNFMPGGNVKGPGTGTSDSIPAYLSNGEYVIRASSVKKYGVEAMDALNAGKFANGGPVNTSALITPSIPYYMADGGMPGRKRREFASPDGKTISPQGKDSGSMLKKLIPSLGLGSFGILSQTKSLAGAYKQRNAAGELFPTSSASPIYVVVSDPAQDLNQRDKNYRPLIKAMQMLSNETGLEFIPISSKDQMPSQHDQYIHAKFKNNKERWATAGSDSDFIPLQRRWNSKEQGWNYTSAYHTEEPSNSLGRINLPQNIWQNNTPLTKNISRDLAVHELIHLLSTVSNRTNLKGEQVDREHAQLQDPLTLEMFNIMQNQVSGHNSYISRDDILSIRKRFNLDNPPIDFSKWGNLNLDEKGNSMGEGVRKANGGLINAKKFHEGGPVGHIHGRNAPKTMGPYRPYGPYVPTFPADKRSNVAKTWDFLKEAGKETGRSIEWSLRALAESIGFNPQTSAPGNVSSSKRYWDPSSPTYMDAEASAAAAKAENKFIPTPFISKDNQIIYDQIAAMRVAGMDSEANKAFAIKTGMSAVNTGSLFLGGALGSATARGIVEAYGINKFGAAGLGTLLPKGSITYAGKTTAGLAANLGAAAMLGATRPFSSIPSAVASSSRNRITDSLIPGISATQRQAQYAKEIVEIEGYKYPTYLNGGDRIVFGGHLEDVSATSAVKARTVPATPQGLLEEALRLNPGNKDLQLMLKNIKSGKLGKQEHLLLDRIAASVAIGDDLLPAHVENTDGFALVLEALSGNFTSQITLEAKTKAFKDYVAANAAKRKEAASVPTSYLANSEPIDPSKAPIFHATPYPVARNADGTVDIYPAGHYGAGKFDEDGLPIGAARSSVHTTPEGVVSGHISRQGGSTHTEIGMDLDTLVKLNGLPYNAWGSDFYWNLNPGEALHFGNAPVITSSIIEAVHKAELIKRGIIKDGDELPLVAVDPKTKDIIRLLKEKYTDLDRLQLFKANNPHVFNPSPNDPLAPLTPVSTDPNVLLSLYRDKIDGFIGREEEAVLELSRQELKKLLGIDTPYTGQSQWSINSETLNKRYLKWAEENGVMAEIHNGSDISRLETEVIDEVGIGKIGQTTQTKESFDSIEAIRMAVLHGYFKTNIENLSDANSMTQMAWLHGIDPNTPEFKAYVREQLKAQGQALFGQANGGYISGAGTGTSDSIPAMLSNGEYVIKANSVKKYGVQAFDALNAGKFANGGYVNGGLDKGYKDGWLQKWSKSVSGNPLSEMLGTAPLLRLISGQGSKGDNLGASMVPLSLLGSGIGAKTFGNLGKYAYAIPNKINQIINQAKVNSMIKGGMWHGSQPVGYRGEEYLQGTNILDGSMSTDPYYGMGFYGTNSRSEASLYASGYNSLNNWGESFGSMNQIVGAPRGKYIDFTRGSKSLKWQDYGLSKALGKSMPENLGDLMNAQGLTGAIMNRVSSGRTPEDIMFAKWLAFSNSAGVMTKEIPGFEKGGLATRPKYGKRSDDLNAYQRFMIGKPDDYGFVDKLFGIPSIRKVLAGKGGAWDYISTLLAPLSGATSSVKSIGNSVAMQAARPVGIEKNSALEAVRLKSPSLTQADSLSDDMLSDYYLEITRLGSGIEAVHIPKLGSKTSSLGSSASIMPSMIGSATPGDLPQIYTLFADPANNPVNTFKTVMAAIAGGSSRFNFTGGTLPLTNSTDLSRDSFSLLERFIKRHPEFMKAQSPTEITNSLHQPGMAFYHVLNKSNWIKAQSEAEKLNLIEKFNMRESISDIDKIKIVNQAYGLENARWSSLLGQGGTASSVSDLVASPGAFAGFSDNLISKGSAEELEDLFSLAMARFRETKIVRLDKSHESILDQMLREALTKGKIGKEMFDSILSGFPQLANGGLIDIPKFEKGINMVPANMLAMLHKNEAVVPANMNPFNPNAQSYSQPSISYNIAPVINAAPGMDEQAIANMATRQVLAEIKVIDARNNASMGRPGTRVVGK